VDIAELYEEVDGDIPWVIEGYLIKGCLTLLAGPPKLGKTTFAYHALVSVSLGKQFIGREITKGNVLLLGLEEHRRDIIQRLQDCSDQDLSGLVKIEFGPLPFDVYVLREMVAYIKQEGIGLVVIDTLPVWWRLSDESDASEVVRKGMPLVQAIHETGAAWLGLVHSRKGGGVTFPRFYRHLHKGENGEIGGDHVSKHSTSVYRGI
jgi:predicted ATP-dependent serine protease